MKNTRSENDILFSCTLDILTGDATVHGEVYNFIDDYFLSKGVEYRNNFSNDNMLAVFCWCNMFDKEYVKELPLFGHFSIHPFRFPFYLYVKYPLLGIWLMPFASMAMIFGALRVKRKDHNGKKVISTSGKILTFLKINTYNMPITKFICDFIINNHKDLKGWRKIFSIYHEAERPHIYEAYLKWEMAVMSNKEKVK